MKALQVVMYIVRIIVDIAQVLTQPKTFNRILVVLMLIAVALIGIIPIVDFFSISAICTACRWLPCSDGNPSIFGD